MNQRATNRDVLMETYKESKKDRLKKREKRGREVSFMLLEEKREEAIVENVRERDNYIYKHLRKSSHEKKKRYRETERLGEKYRNS